MPAYAALSLNFHDNKCLNASFAFLVSEIKFPLPNAEIAINNQFVLEEDKSESKPSYENKCLSALNKHPDDKCSHGYLFTCFTNTLLQRYFNLAQKISC